MVTPVIHDVGRVWVSIYMYMYTVYVMYMCTCIYNMYMYMYIYKYNGLDCPFFKFHWDDNKLYII